LNKGLIIFAREPVPGRVKTRLAKNIGDQAAADLYAAMLGDVINIASSLNDVRIFIFWDLEGEAFPVLNGSAQPVMLRQEGCDLGERMVNAFKTAFANGIDTCCIIGSDSPDLPTEFIIQAFDNLTNREADIVYGPAEDGGYYLLGMKHVWLRLFEDIPWGGPDVTSTTCLRIDELKLHYTTLPAWYDIDTLTELHRLAESPGKSAPLTRSTLQSIFSDLDSTFSPGAL